MGCAERNERGVFICKNARCSKSLRFCKQCGQGFCEEHIIWECECENNWKHVPVGCVDGWNDIEKREDCWYCANEDCDAIGCGVCGYGDMSFFECPECENIQTLCGECMDDEVSVNCESCRDEGKDVGVRWVE